MSFGPNSERNIIGLVKCASPELGQYLQRRRRGILIRTRAVLGYSQARLAEVLTSLGVECSCNTIARYENPNGTKIPSCVADAVEALLLASTDKKAMGA